MKLVEFRVILPMTVEEYQVAQLYSVAEASKNETGGGDGIEVKLNEPFDTDTPKTKDTPLFHTPTKPYKYQENTLVPSPLISGSKEKTKEYKKGQYTHKIYKVQNKVPGWLKALAPKGSLHFEEKAWNAYPYCRTIIDNPKYMKETFFLMIETMHMNDNGEEENIHNLPPDLLAKREVIRIDIANDYVRSSDYKASEDPTQFRSEKTGRGPLRRGEQLCWAKDGCMPTMCCYKLVSIYFKWFGLQGRVEKFLQTTEQRLFLNFHRQVFCWMDKWYGLTMEDIRRLEDITKEELDKQITSGQLRGTCDADQEEET